jgi:hypothetical protein
MVRGQSVYFSVYNRGKKSLCLDLRNARPAPAPSAGSCSPGSGTVIAGGSMPTSLTKPMIS